MPRWFSRPNVRTAGYQGHVPNMLRRQSPRCPAVCLPKARWHIWASAATQSRAPATCLHLIPRGCVSVGYVQRYCPAAEKLVSCSANGGRETKTPGGHSPVQSRYERHPWCHDSPPARAACHILVCPSSLLFNYSLQNYCKLREVQNKKGSFLFSTSKTQRKMRYYYAFCFFSDLEDEELRFLHYLCVFNT